MNKHIETKIEKIKKIKHGDYIKTDLSLAYGNQKGILLVFFKNVYSGYTFYSKKLKKS